ncbi:hypothetical protein, partial [Mesorhizobium sp.]|uniref:hypothetical protein n=1 Tax=Mesorhizobium sp. TaxID=1871066 RepID=UPI00257F0E27
MDFDSVMGRSLELHADKGNRIEPHAARTPSRTPFHKKTGAVRDRAGSFRPRAGDLKWLTRHEAVAAGSLVASAQVDCIV